MTGPDGKETRELRKKLRICTQCGKEDARAGKITCATCAAKEAARYLIRKGLANDRN